MISFHSGWKTSAFLAHTHGLIFDLIERRIVTGLRIDHVDGLYDPTTYLQELRKRMPTTYIVVEKILNLKEDLPHFWPVQGTTGYDFTNYVNELFCQKENVRAFSKIYSSVTGSKNLYEDVVTDNKRLDNPGRYGKRRPQPRPTPERDLQPGPSWKRHNPQCDCKEL